MSDTIDADTLRSALDRITGRIAGDASWLTRHLGGGKLLRARLVMAVADIGGAQHRERALEAAGQIEAIHAGALMHDDIVDGSIVRRGRPTLWRERGTRAALCAGVTVILDAYAGIEPANEARRHALTGHLREIARGQTDELTLLFATSVSPHAYLRRAYAKTGSLHELAARLGAWAGNLDPPTTHAVAQFAGSVGTAFQLVDDVRDLTGEALLGRSPGTDLRAGVYTLPVLLTLAGRHAGGERLHLLLARLSTGGSLGPCVELLHANGAVDATLRCAKRLVYEGLAALWEMPCMRGRTELDAYAWDLIGSVRVEDVARQDVAAAPVPDVSPAASTCGSIDPGLRLAVAPGVMQRLSRLASAVRSAPQLVGAITSSAALMLLADEAQGVTTSAESRALTGSVDLLLAEVMGNLASLPADVGTVVAQRLAGVFLEGAMGRAFDDEALREFALGVTADAARC
jgi:geranylgeranyl pyrophosphate synthase